MINMATLEQSVVDMAHKFARATPYPHVVIDNVCDDAKLSSAIASIAERVRDQSLDSSGDLIFARNKFVESRFEKVGPLLEELRDDLLSERFALWLEAVTGERLFLDPEFYGGGLHAGGDGSYLDMHTDFNYHPEHLGWKRQVNILLYLNQGWEPAFGGELLMLHTNNRGEEPDRIAPLFNRLVVMETSGVTLHGYDPISFPAGSFRLSIAAYAYKQEEGPGEKARSTLWYPRSGGKLKQVAGRVIPAAISKLRGLRRG